MSIDYCLLFFCCYDVCPSVVGCLLIVVRCLSLVVCLMFVVSRYVVRCLWYVVCCVLCAIRCMCLVVCRLLFDVCSVPSVFVL